MDPKTVKVKNKDGKEESVPYAPRRFKELVNECYLISKNLNTSYTDVRGLSALERTYLLQLIYKDKKEEQEAIDKSIQESKERLEAIKHKRR